MVLKKTREICSKLFTDLCGVSGSHEVNRLAET